MFDPDLRTDAEYSYKLLYVWDIEKWYCLFYTGTSEVRLLLCGQNDCVWSRVNEKWIFVCVEELGRHAKYRISLDLKISVICR